MTMLELAAIIVLGILAQWVAWKTKVPAILPLIIIGLLVGPISTMYTEDGCKWIQPRGSAECDNYLFHGDLLFYFVSLAIGIILFEGGLTLKKSEIKGVGPAIIKLITVGSLVTFIGGGIITYYLMDLSWAISFLFSGLIIVTGPTVIAPILRNIPLTRNVATVLKWEGILIDPIGALVAVLVFDFIISGEGTGTFTLHAFQSFAKIVFMGLALGATAAYALYQLIKSDLIPHYLLNVFTLALVILVFVFSDMLEHESGLLSVVIMGMVLGNLEVPKLKEILDFKEALSVLLISILFILLSANIDMDQLALVLDWRCAILFVLVVFLLRPIGVFLSTTQASLNNNEKAFISWVGPRGIVAAGVASLFGIKLMDQGVPGAEYITPLVFLIVLGTVLLNATTARMIARLLRVTQDSSNGILIFGANAVGRIIGKYLKEQDVHVVLVDSNRNNIMRCKAAGIDAIQANIYTDELGDELELNDMGYLLSLTGNSDVNTFALNKFGKEHGENGAVRLISSDEMRMPDDDKVKLPVLSTSDDHISISRIARDFPEVNEVSVSGYDDFKVKFENVHKNRSTIPLFFKKDNGQLDFIPPSLDMEVLANVKELVYMGEEMNFEPVTQESLHE